TGARRRRVKGDPAVARKEDLYPTVRVARANDVVAAHIVVFAGKKAIHVTRGHADGAHHHGHGRGEIFAMPGALLEEEVGQGIDRRLAGKVQRIAVIIAEVTFDDTV